MDSGEGEVAILAVLLYINARSVQKELLRLMPVGSFAKAAELPWKFYILHRRMPEKRHSLR